jgi:hypothetical protein
MHHGHLLKFIDKSWRLKEPAGNLPSPSNRVLIALPAAAGWGILTRTRVEE